MGLNRPLYYFSEARGAGGGTDVKGWPWGRCARSARFNNFCSLALRLNIVKEVERSMAFLVPGLDGTSSRSQGAIASSNI